jgi:hypothetical protein
MKTNALEALPQSLEVFNLQVGPLTVQSTRAPIQVTPAEIADLRERLPRWAQAYPRSEETFAWGTLQVPTVIARFDYSVNQETGMVNVYEIEERPFGLALTTQLVPTFAARTRAIVDALAVTTQRPVGVYVAPDRVANTDDMMLADTDIFDHVVDDVTAVPSDALLLVRAERTDESVRHLTHRSISTIASEGSKAYGLEMGMWERATVSSIDFNRPFVLKPHAGCRCQGVEIWHPSAPKGIGGFSTRTRIMRAIESGTAAYVQPFYEPESCPHIPEAWMVRRLFFGFNAFTSQWSVLGGLWIGRKNAKLHGSMDSITGPLALP